MEIVPNERILKIRKVINKDLHPDTEQEKKNYNPIHKAQDEKITKNKEEIEKIKTGKSIVKIKDSIFKRDYVRLKTLGRKI